MITKNFFRIAVFFFFCTSLVSAQQPDQSSVVIRRSSSIQIPADEIFFTVFLSSSNENPSKAFEEHKILEKNLLKIFKESEIPDSNISYSLLNLSNTRPHSKEQPLFQTRQIVGVKLYDFSVYEPLQLALLSNDIYNFNAKFSAGESDELIEKGIQKAIKEVTKEAEITARNSGKKLGEFLEIESSHYYPSASEGITAMTVQQSGETLIELPRFVQMSVFLRVRFTLLEKED